MSERWVVRLPNWLGDTVMALPTLRAIEAQVPETIVWGAPELAQIVAAAGSRAAYLPYRRRRGAPGWSDAIAGAADLRRQRADAIVLLPNAFEAALLAKIAGIERRVGYPTDGRRRLLTDVVADEQPRHGVHEAARFARLAEHCGFGPIDDLDRRVAIDLADDDPGTSADDGAGARAGNGNGDRGVVGIFAGSANDPAKRWPAPSFAALIERIAAHWGARAVLFGSEADRAVNREIAERCAVDVTDATGGTLAELLVALTGCRMIIGNDTGGTHVAAALGRPTAVVFGPTDPGRTRPLGARVTVLSAGRFCQPCGYGRCPLDHACMESLEADEVVARLDTVWASAA